MYFTLAFLFYVFYRVYQYFFPAPNIDPKGKYVLISGCDTGFGHGLAVELDKQGFNVLAGVLTQNSVTLLQSELSKTATVFQLDITKENDINTAFELVKGKTATLHALVNNAGIGAAGFIDWVSIEFAHKTMDVNYFGHVAMTKKFLPLLIAKRGSRVVNVCSVMGFLSPPSMSAYCASKHAFESFSDCLRREMFPWGLCVSIIEPGWIRTPIIQGHDRLVRELWNSLSVDKRESWGEDFFNDLVEKSITNSPFINNAENPMKVVRALQHAVMNTKPCIRYLPDWQAKLIFYPLSMLPTWLTDIIMRQFTYPSSPPVGVNNQIKD